MKKSFYFAVILASAQLLAQTDRANLTGTVTDPSGAVVAGASVMAVASGTAVNRSTETNSYGRIIVLAIPTHVDINDHFARGSRTRGDSKVRIVWKTSATKS